MIALEEFFSAAVLIFALGLASSLLLERQEVVVFAVLIAIQPLWTLLRSGIRYLRYVARRRLMRRVR